MSLYWYLVWFFFIALVVAIYNQTLVDKNVVVQSFEYDPEKDDAIRLSKCGDKNVRCVRYQVDKPNESLVIVKEKRPYLFIHIPKNAGTYLRKIFPGMNGGHDHITLATIRRYMPKLVRNNHTFAIVRNPWERTVSMYNNHVNTNHMDIKGWGNYGMRILRKHKVRNFTDFVRLLYKHRNKIRGLGEIVWEKQIHFISDKKGKVIVDQIIRMENLDTEIERLKKRFDITLPTPPNKINVSGTKEYRTYYTPETKALVSIIFKEDIALTGYTFD